MPFLKISKHFSKNRLLDNIFPPSLERIARTCANDISLHFVYSLSFITLPVNKRRKKKKG